MTLKHFTITTLSFALLAVLPLSAGITFVQQSYTTSNPSGSSLRVAYPAAQKAGNLNLVVVGWNDTTSSVSSVTDSKGNTYTRAIGPTAGTALTQSIYYAKNIAAGSNTVTVTFNKAAAYPDVRVLEYSGADTANPLDVTVAAVGTGLTANSGLAATTSLNELIFGAGMTFDVYKAAGSGFTNRVITNFGDIAEDAPVLSMGSYSATASLRSSAPWVMQMAAFRGQSSSTPAFSVSGISPSAGPASGGTKVTITGTGFLAGATVKFRGAPAANVTVTSSAITASTPANTAGTVNVVVTNGNGQSGTLTNGYTYTGSTSAAISFAQLNYKTATSASSLAAAYPSAQTAGNLNIVVVGWNDTTSAVSSITDSRGNTYTRAVGPTAGTALTQSIYFAKNIAAGSNTVTVVFSTTAAYPDLRVLEYSGVDPTNPLDVTAGASGTGLTGNSGTATTTSANELVFGAGMTFDVYNAAGSGFTNRVITNFGDIAEDRSVTATGSYSATGAIRASAPWVMQMATFRARSVQVSSKHSVSLSWNASSSTIVAYYDVYRGTVSGGPYTLLGSNIKATSYTDSTVQAGVTYYYVTTTVDTAGLESIFSNQFKCTIPSP